MSSATSLDPRQRHVSWRVAGRLLQAARRDEAEHTILRENLATHLGKLEPDYVASLEQLPLDKVIDGLNGSYAHCYGQVDVPLKISRDIRQKPYSDQQVMQRLDELDGKLKSEVRRVVEQSQPYPCRFYTCGSIEKGRFGAASDVDLLLEASPEWMKQNRFKLQHDDVSFQLIDMQSQADKADYIAAFSPTREVSVEEIAEPGFLRKLYREGVEKKGYTLEGDHLKPLGEVAYGPEPVPEQAKRIFWSLPMV